MQAEGVEALTGTKTGLVGISKVALNVECTHVASAVMTKVVSMVRWMSLAL